MDVTIDWATAKKLGSVCTKLARDVTLRVEPDKIVAFGINDANTAMFVATVKPKATNGVPQEGAVFGTYTQIWEPFKKIKGGVDATIKISDDGTRITVVLHDRTQRRFSFALTAAEHQKPPTIALKPTGSAKMKLKDLREAVELARNYNSKGYIKIRDGKIMIGAKGIRGEFEQEIPASEDVQIDGEAEALYDFDRVLFSVVKALSSDSVKIELAKDAPLHIISEEGNITVEVYVAPYVERT